MQLLAPNYVLEQAWQALLAPIMPTVGAKPLPIILSDAPNATLHPNLTVVATDLMELDMPGVGVFWAHVKIQYETKITSTTPTQAETIFGSIVQAFYYASAAVPILNQALAYRLTQAWTNFTCYGIKNFKINQAVYKTDKLWQKSVEMDCAFMTRDNV